MDGKVTISLNEYWDLKEFEKEIKANKTFRLFHHGYAGEIYYHDYITTDETIKDIINANKGLSDVVGKLNTEIYNLKNPEKKEVTIKDVKKFTIWQFLKWRKND